MTGFILPPTPKTNVTTDNLVYNSRNEIRAKTTGFARFSRMNDALLSAPIRRVFSTVFANK